MQQLESGYLQINDLNKKLRECRSMAYKLGFTIRWRIKNRTATALLKYNHTHIVWKGNFTHDMPHMVICLMYHGVYTELFRREEENRIAALRMKQLEEERNKERKVMNMQSWQDRKEQSKEDWRQIN